MRTKGLSLRIILTGIFLIVLGCSVYAEQKQRNPFIPLIKSYNQNNSVVSKEISLDGILFDKNNKAFAIINDTLVCVGDTIDGFAILKIESDYVEVQSGQKKIKIFLIAR